MLRRLLLGSALCVGLISGRSADAAVVLTFDTTTEGVNGNTAWSSFNGGSVAITSQSGYQNSSAILNLAGNAPLFAEYQAALANGGTLTFDYFVNQADVVDYDPADAPGWFEPLIIANTSGGWDPNVYNDAGLYGNIPTTYSASITMDVVAGAPTENDDILQFGVASTWNEVFLGLNSESGTFTTATYYIDNLTLSANPVAVPEPSSLALLGLVSAGGLAYRKRRANKA